MARKARDAEDATSVVEAWRRVIDLRAHLVRGGHERELAELDHAIVRRGELDFLRRLDADARNPWIGRSLDLLCIMLEEHRAKRTPSAAIVEALEYAVRRGPLLSDERIVAALLRDLRRAPAGDVRNTAARIAAPHFGLGVRQLKKIAGKRNRERERRITQNPTRIRVRRTAWGERLVH